MYYVVKTYITEIITDNRIGYFIPLFINAMRYNIGYMYIYSYKCTRKYINVFHGRAARVKHFIPL